MGGQTQSQMFVAVASFWHWLQVLTVFGFGFGLRIDPKGFGNLLVSVVKERVERE